ncbi:hypothetical protein ACFFH7_33910 [Kutzneria chonburiensis]|uniref:Gram-positive cocci surface proteins LPxTG domain-containing protein n=1 Tax=Kutzneria chonburiensis TaxID=1483604 RepID=A0ABV6N3I2_9PSEU
MGGRAVWGDADVTRGAVTTDPGDRPTLTTALGGVAAAATPPSGTQVQADPYAPTTPTAPTGQATPTLAYTGVVDLFGLSLAAGAALVIGAGLVLLSRRRRTS